MLKSDLTGDDNLVPKMGLAPQCTIYIAEIIRRALIIPYSRVVTPPLLKRNFALKRGGGGGGRKSNILGATHPDCSLVHALLLSRQIKKPRHVSCARGRQSITVLSRCGALAYSYDAPAGVIAPNQHPCNNVC